VTFKKDYQLEGPTTIVFYQQLMSACDKAELKIKRERPRTCETKYLKAIFPLDHRTTINHQTRVSRNNIYNNFKTIFSRAAECLSTFSISFGGL